MLGLLGRALVGFAGPDSELPRGGKKPWEPRQRVHTFPCVARERVFFKQTGLTMVVRAVLPERFPFPEIERHAALGVDYHRE